MLTCQQCGLCKGRTRVVPGEGPDTAEVMLIGEAPGQNEDRQGRPFVGAAGQFLNELLGLAGLKREDVYIANVIKCRPPGNRDPLPAEIAACKPWLDEQIELIKPKVIVTLGRFSMSRWFSGQSISRIHGQPIERDGVLIYPMFHPAAALHQPQYKEAIQADMRKLGDMLRSMHGEPAATPEPEPETAPEPTPLPAAKPATSVTSPIENLELRAQPTQVSFLDAPASPPKPAAPAEPAPSSESEEPKQLSFF